MKDKIDAYLEQVTSRWVEGVIARARAVSIGAIVLTLALGGYAAMRLGINSDNVRMLADTLPSKIAYAEFSKFFPNLDDALLIVVDGETADLARTATIDLERALAERTDRFTDVYQPGGGSFFEKNGLLYRSPEELDQFTDQMAQLQPVLAELERDPSIASLARIIELGLATVRNEGRGQADWSMILDRVGQATVSIFDEFPIAVSWEEVLLRGSSIDVATRRVIVAHPILDFGDVLAAGESLDVIREIAAQNGLTEARGVTVRITGNPALNYEEMVGLAWDIGGAGVFCFFIVCGVLYLALRSWKLTVAAVATLLMGLIITAAFAAATVGDLNLLSLAFGVLFIGLGVDFAIHLGTQYVDLLRRDRTVEAALSEATRKVGSSLVICTVSTAIGFFVFLPSDYRGVAELGLITGTGMFIILVLTLTVLPAFLAGWLRIDTSAGVPEPVRFDGAWLDALPHHARSVLMVAALGAAGGLILIASPGVSFDTNVVRMRNPETESVQTFNDLMEMAGMSPWYANVVGSDLAEADRLAERLTALDTVDQAVTLSDYVPAEQEEKLEQLMDVAMMLEAPPGTGGGILGPPPTLEEQVVSLRNLRDFLEEGWVGDSTSPLAGSMRLLHDRLSTYLARIDTEGNEAETLASLQRVLLSKLPTQIGRLRAAVSAEEIGLDDLPDKLRLRMLAPTGQARVQIFPTESLHEPAALSRFIEAVRTVDPMASGISVNLYDFGRATVASFQQAIVLALLLISILLWVLWRSPRDMLFALSPMVLSGTLTVGAMAALGISFNFANVIVLPLLFGVGVDSGIHLVHRSHMRIDDAEELLHTTTARAVFYSAFTTIVSFGTLAFSSHRGVATLGVLLTIGMFLTMVCNLIVLPALIQVVRPVQREAASPAVVSGGAD